jgi:FtsP/CotA-like multicopper oxidase with cupredoxin domain
MKTMSTTNRASGALAIGVVAALVLLAAGSAAAQARIDGIMSDATGTVTDPVTLDFTAKAGEVSTPDGGSVHFWGYEDLEPNASGHEGVGLPQYPGPTLILNQNDSVTITLTSELPFGQCTSIVFPGHAVTASDGSSGLLTREACPGDALPVTYTFTASQPGTYMYHSGTKAELQIEMGLVGTIIVWPTGVSPDPEINPVGAAYNDPSTQFHHEYLFLLTQMDPIIHQLAEQNRFAEIDMTEYYPVYWFINGRAAPDTPANPFVAWLPHQPYNSLPRMRPGENLLMRIVGAGQGQHPFHFHGNNADQIARDGRMLMHPRSRFTTLTVPGQTVDQIFTWTGKGMGWDIYGDPTDPAYAHGCSDGNADDFDDDTHEYCPDHGKLLPVEIPETQNLAFGGFWSGSPFMGDVAPLPPGEGGLNPFGGFFFMWHSHAEKELANFDIFPGGMLTMMVVEPPGTQIP